MTQRLCVAVVGGGIDTQHIEAYRKLPELYKVRVFCDIDEAKTRAVAERFQIPDTLGDFEEVLRSIGAFLDARGMKDILLAEVPDGFIVHLTKPVATAWLSNPMHYELTTYTYHPTREYGGPRR